MKFANVTNDIAFRKIFGNQQKTKILISFLNAILKFREHEKIVSITIINPYLLPRVAGEKASIIDVRAVDARGRNFIVEMQVAEASGFDKRVQYYVSRDYSMQIDTGEDYLKLRPTIFIAILDFAYFETEDYLSYHLILDEKTLENKLKDIRFCFIELPKFQKELEAVSNLIDSWIYFIKNAEDLTVIPDEVKDEGLLEAYSDADRHKWTKNELIEYDISKMREQDAKGRITFAIEKAVESTTEKSIRKIIQRGKATDTEIAEDFEISIEYVRELRAKIQNE